MTASTPPSQAEREQHWNKHFVATPPGGDDDGRDPPKRSSPDRTLH